jgi:hypothetical protein
MTNCPVLGLLQLPHEVRIKIEPSLRIDFHGRTNTYFQEMDVMMGGEYIESFRAINQTYRICVINTGSKVVENVQVRLNSIKPYPDNLYRLPLPLRFMNDSKPFKFFKSIASKQSEFIDVLSYPKGYTARNMIYVEHLHEDIGHLIKANKYEIEIIATGNDVPGVKKKFNIQIKKGELFMVLI